MENIYLCTPIVLSETLDDMNPKQKQTALEILHHKKFITYSETGFTFLTTAEAMKSDKIYHGGSEGVCIYRQILGLEDCSIRMIPVNEIFDLIDDFYTLEDLVKLLSFVDSCNCSFSKLRGLNAPSLILWNAENRLYRAIEQLQYNPEGEDQFMKCIHEVNVEDETCECHQIPRRSLFDIDYTLINVDESENAETEED